MNNNRRPRAPGELENKFKNQMELLVRACKAFDAGQEIEAENIAGRLRILLHHNPKKGSHSLLAQINLLSKLSFVDSGVRRARLVAALSNVYSTDFIPHPFTWEAGLVIPGIYNGYGKFIAPLQRNRYSPSAPPYSCIQAPADFDDWWHTKFIETYSGKIFSRHDIVMTMANQDGGSHVDPEIDADFSDFCQETQAISFGVTNDPNNLDSVKPMETNIAYASIRQIAYELMLTIDDYSGTDWNGKAFSLRPDIRPMILPTIAFK